MKYSDQYLHDVRAVTRNIPNINTLKNRKIFISGASGMICSGVVEILQYLNLECNYGMEIILGGRSEERLNNRFPRNFVYKFVRFEATEQIEYDFEVDYIIHGASNSDPASYVSFPSKIILVNIIGTNALLQLAKRRGAKLLYISSSEVYGAKEDSLPFSESKYGYIDVLNPRNCYANAKRAAENLCISYGVEYGVNSDIVRPGHIYGPSSTDSDSRAAAQFMRNAVHGDDIVLKSSGTQLRSYCYTLDCASAILSVLINGESLNAYNISNKDSIVNIRNVAEKFAELGGVKLVFQAPSDAEAKGYSLMANSSLDSRKLEGLGWRAQFDLETGVRNCIKYFEMLHS